MKLCPICERWRVSSYKQTTVAICGKCFTVVDSERATIQTLQIARKYKNG